MVVAVYMKVNESFDEQMCAKSQTFIVLKKNEYHSICNTHTLQSFSTKYTTSNIRHRTIFTNVIKTSEKNIPSPPYISGSLLVFPLFIFSVNIYVDPQCFSHHIFAYMYEVWYDTPILMRFFFLRTFVYTNKC